MGFCALAVEFVMREERLGKINAWGDHSLGRLGLHQFRT